MFVFKSKFKNFKKSASLLLIVLSLSSFSQNDNIYFKRISSQDGLSQNWVRCIYQDNTGYMWFGTSGGLNRFDGYDFKHYSIGGVNVNAILKKSNYELWVANDFGAFIYDYRKDSIFPFNYLKNQSVLCILQDIEKNIWFGTNAGVFKFNPSDLSVVSYTHIVDNTSSLSNNYINTLFEDSEHNIWIGTKIGLNKFQKHTKSFKRYLFSDVKGSISGNDIMSICEDHNKRIWIGTAQNGVNLLTKSEKGAEKFIEVVDGCIVSLLVDRYNYLWIARSSNGGLLKLNLTNFSMDRKPEFIHCTNSKIDNRSISDNSIYSLYEDKLHDIWIGTFGGGLNYFSYRSKKFYSVMEGFDQQPLLGNKLINAICEDEKYLWLGTEGGLDRYDKTNKTTKHFQYERNNKLSLGANPVYSMHKDYQGNLWIGTWGGGLSLYNKKNESFKRFIPDGKQGSLSNGNVFAIFEDTKDNLWVGTIGGGLNCYNYKTDKFIQYRHDKNNPKSISTDVVNDVIETTDGRLLISSYSSLEQYNYETNDFSHFPINPDNISDLNRRFIIFIFEDSHKNIWIGTNKGMVLFNNSNTFVLKYTVSNGLPSNFIEGIIEDNSGNLWISTMLGLSKLMHGVNCPTSPKFINFSQIDGLSNDEFKRRSLFKNNDGILYVGSSNGYTYFNPDSIFLNNIAPNIVITDLQLLQSNTDRNGELQSIVNVNQADTVVLKYNKSDFIIKFAALNYLNTSKNKYKYKLEGYDNYWIQSDNSRMATYKNLEPGSYTFMIVGSNNDNVWSSPKSLKIIIYPPWWRTWVFYVFIFVLFLSSLYGFYKIRFAVLNQQKRKLEQNVAERTKELMEMNTLLEETKEEIIQQNKELHQHRNNLELLVENRTVELTNAKAKAEESDHLKTAFLQNMSHEIRTPLNAIMGFSNLLPKNFNDIERLKKFTTIIKQRGTDLLEIINDILDIAKIESGQLAVHSEECNLNTLFSEIETFFTEYRVRINKQQVDFKINPHCTIIDKLVLIDSGKLKQILINLITNAFKFTHTGHIEIGCNVTNNNFLTFYVSDTGIGIPKEKQTLIFERFMQVSADSSRLYGGTGLGFSIVKGLLNILGGEIWLDSEPDKGSTFHFSVPYRLIDKEINILSIECERPALSNTNIIVLIVEDDIYNAEYLKEVLSETNYTILHADCGEKAVEMAISQNVDLILMDIRLPGISGHEATRLIKKQKSGIKVIAQTAYATSSDSQKAIDAGCDKYISKPVSREKLFELIDQLINK